MLSALMRDCDIGDWLDASHIYVYRWCMQCLTNIIGDIEIQEQQYCNVEDVLAARSQPEDMMMKSEEKS